MAHAQRARGRPDLAREHWRQALALLARIGVERTEDADASVGSITANLAGLGH
jgi:hypothetical protein